MLELQQIADAIMRQGSHVLQYALALAGVGTLAMALVELLKGVFMARRMYNRWSVRQWTAGRKRSMPALLNSPLHGEKGKIKPIQVELELLAAGGHDYADALYDQPVEKLMGQIQAAVHVAMDFPECYPLLYTFITQIPRAYWDGDTPPATAADPDTWALAAPAVRKIRAGEPLSDAASADPQAGAQARARLVNLVARQLDAFQTETQYFWERLNQWTAVMAGTIIFYIACVMAIANTGVEHPLLLLLVSLPAGIMAPFAKNLSSALSSFGK